MKVGDLVKTRPLGSYQRPGCGIIIALGKPNPIASVLWSNGSAVALHISDLEVVHESR